VVSQGLPSAMANLALIGMATGKLPKLGLDSDSHMVGWGRVAR
jgi:alpha-tubulin suppressor-like RCC1 family protein